MFKEILNSLTDLQKMKLINIILKDMGPVIDIENRGTSDDYVVKPLTYNADSDEIYVEFKEVKRQIDQEEE